MIHGDAWAAGRVEDLQRERGPGDRRHGDGRRPACLRRRSVAARVGAAPGGRGGSRGRTDRVPCGRERRGRRSAPRAGLHLHARHRLHRPARARRRRALRSRRHDRPPRPCHALLLRSLGRSRAPVGRAACVVAAADGGRDRGSGAPSAPRRGARPLRDRRGAEVAVASVAGDPRRRHPRQRAGRCARADQRHHRLRRHEPHGARLRPVLRAGVAADGACTGRRGAARDALHRRLSLRHPSGARGARRLAGPRVDAARHGGRALRLAGQAPPRQRLPAGVGRATVAPARLSRGRGARCVARAAPRR